MIDPVLSVLIAEGTEIVKEAADAEDRQGSTATIHIDQVVDWHRRASNFIAGRSPALLSQVPGFQRTDALKKISVAVSSTLSVLRSLSQSGSQVTSTARVATSGARSSASAKGASHAEPPKSIEEVLLGYLPRRRLPRVLIVLIIGVLVLGWTVWSGLPDGVKTKVLDNIRLGERSDVPIRPPTDAGTRTLAPNTNENTK